MFRTVRLYFVIFNFGYRGATDICNILHRVKDRVGNLLYCPKANATLRPRCNFVMFVVVSTCFLSFRPFIRTLNSVYLCTY